MDRTVYYFDTETSQYKRHYPSRVDNILNRSGIAILATLIGLAMTLTYNFLFESPRELKLANEVREMEFYYKELDKKVQVLSSELGSIEDRDDNIYRNVLGSPKIDKSVRNGGRGGYERYSDISDKKLADGNLIIKLNEKVDRIRRKLYIESKSQDELVLVSGKKEKQYASIPAIQPVSNKELIGIASGFGLRIHPIYKVIKPHTGIDFAAPLARPSTQPPTERSWQRTSTLKATESSS